MKKVLLMIMLVSVALTTQAKKRFAITMTGENLATLTQVTDNQEPCLDPFGGDDGSPLYFSVRENKRYYNIYKKENPFSASMSQKTSGKNNNRYPCYNKSTDKLAFSCQQDGAYTSDIYTMFDNKGKALSQVTESSDAYESSPSFNKEGDLIVYDKIAYTYYRKANWATFLFGFDGNTVVVENSEIWMKNLKTGETTLLGNGYSPCFSPDGKSIAYVKYSSDAKSTSIWVMKIDGSEQVQITDAKKGFALNPRWSPDGKRLIFQSSKKDKKDADLYVVDTDGNNLTQLTINNSYDGQPYWTTDGYIYFVSDRGNEAGNYQIWRFKYE